MAGICIGLIGGSGLLKSDLPMLRSCKEEVIATAHGRVFLRCGTLPVTGGGTVGLVFVQRHDATPARVYTQPADVNYAGIALALQAKGVTHAFGVYSVGSLKPSLRIGALLVCDDFYCPADLRRVYSDARAHLMPGFDDSLRDLLLSSLRGAGLHPSGHGTYVNTRGPRFETKSEIRQMAALGDVVGMTAAHECVACNEVGIPFAGLCMVDNYANGVGAEALTLDAFHAAQAANLRTVEKCVTALLAHLPDALVAALPAAAAAAGDAAGEASPSATSSASTPVVTPAPSSPAGPIPVDLVVHARYVVPVAPGREGQVLDHHSLVVHASRIIDLLPTRFATERYAATRTIHLSEEHALIPGLVNAHTHTPLNLLRGVADDLPLATWLTEQIWPTEARLVSHDFCRVGATAAIAEMIRSGITCFNDMYFFPTATAEAMDAAGVRGNVAMVVMEFPTNYASDAADYLSKGLAMADSWAAGKRTDRVRFTLGPHAPYTVSDATFTRIEELSRSMGCKVHLHLHETAGEVSASREGAAASTKHLSECKCSPIENLARLGVLNERLIAVHMTCLTDAEIALLAAAKTSVVHCPCSNMKLASGFCPVAKLLAAGVNVALGTDSASSNNSLDMFGEVKMAALIAKGYTGDATAVPAWQALRMATLNGAIALGWENEVGSLEVGKRADFVAVDLSGLDSLPVYNVLSHLVYATNRSCVTDVWVDGQQLLSERRLTTIDEAALRADLKVWAEKVRPGATAEAKHAHLPPDAVKHMHTEAHGEAEKGHIHVRGEGAAAV